MTTVLIRSTLTGNKGIALDEKKMRAIVQDVRRVACYSTTQTEFDAKIRPIIRESISNLCRMLRNLERKKE